MATRTNFEMIVCMKEYAPQDRRFTSREEMDRIASHFELEGRDRIDLQNLRDMVVLVYGNWTDDSREYDPELCRRQLSAMQSIVAVIDYYKYNA